MDSLVYDRDGLGWWGEAPLPSIRPTSDQDEQSTVSLVAGLSAYVADAVGPFEHNGAQLEATPADAIATAVAGLAMNSAVFLLSVIFAVAFLRGANWARIGITVLFVLGVIARFASPLDPISVAAGLIELVAVTLLWLPASNRFFRSVKRDRALHRSRQLA